MADFEDEKAKRQGTQVPLEAEKSREAYLPLELPERNAALQTPWFEPHETPVGLLIYRAAKIINTSVLFLSHCIGGDLL